MVKGFKMPIIHRTSNNVDIYVENGDKSPNDFIVKYQEPGKHKRTPKHIHLIVDLFAKRTGNPTITNALLDHIINNIINAVKPISQFPPSITIYNPNTAKSFSDLDKYGEYSIEFILVVIELIMIQEKTNYPRGTMNLKLFQTFRNGGDIFQIVSAATFR